MSGLGAARAAAYDAASRQQQRQLFMGMNAYDRHKKMVHDLITYYGGKLPQEGQTGPQKTDYDVLRENFRFIRSEEDDAADSWEVKLAKRYYSKLFKEYAIADLSRHREGKVGLRWRTQREVVNGRGQFVCGAKGCDERRGLASFEVPFAYQEAGERRQALVKVRLCPAHAYQLNYRKHKEAERLHKQQQRREERLRLRKARRSSKEKGKAKGRKKRRSNSSRASSSSSGSSGSEGATSSSDSSSSSEEDEERQEGAGEEQRGGGKRQRRSVPAEGAAQQPTAQQQQQQQPNKEGPASDDFEAFFQGLFE